MGVFVIESSARDALALLILLMINAMQGPAGDVSVRTHCWRHQIPVKHSATLLMHIAFLPKHSRLSCQEQIVRPARHFLFHVLARILQSNIIWDIPVGT
jgi:hypothetical protein